MEDKFCMRTNRTDNISFKTNIKIVSPYKFRRITNKMKNFENCQCIEFWDIVPYIDGPTPAYRTNVEYGYTKGVRSCTAVLTAKERNKAQFFGHMDGSKYNMLKLPLIKNKMKQGDNVIIIGAKPEYEDSVDFCNKVQRVFKRKRKPIPITKLCFMDNQYEANIAYESGKDIMYLCIKYCGKNHPFVKSMKNLKKVFKQVEISPKDKIIFPNAKELVASILGF